MKPARISWLLLVSALLISLWLGVTWAVEISGVRSHSISRYLFMAQDMPALLLGCSALALAAFASRFAPQENGMGGKWPGGGLPPDRLRSDCVVGSLLAVQRLQSVA